MNTTENNKLIAEFMGFLPRIKNPKYHNDWNILMQVVEKIESLGYELQKENNSVFFKGNYTEISSFYGMKKYYKTEFNKDCNSTFIEAVYNACIEFIKWYNQNTQQNEK